MGCLLRGTGGDREVKRYGRGGGGGGGGVGRGGGAGAMPKAALSPPETEIVCIKTGCGESDFNVSDIVRGKVTIKAFVHKPQLLKTNGEPKRGIEPKSSAYQPNALPIGQTGSPLLDSCLTIAVKQKSQHQSNQKKCFTI